MNIAIIGLGLIGGSIALALKNKGLVENVYGVDNNQEHAHTAIELGLVDTVVELNHAIDNSDLIVVAIPVSACVAILPTILDRLNSRQVVIDVGSTKQSIIEAITEHPNRKRFVPTHPMWGTEFSGPKAATLDSFAGKACVICNENDCDTDALVLVETLYKNLGMYLRYMDAATHDLHVAYISHISHITSFALANTVLEKEQEASTIFELASGGFESTVRLAKSNAAMWVPVLLQNKDNILDVLNEHIHQLSLFKQAMENNDAEEINHLIKNANAIRKVLAKKQNVQPVKNPI